MDDLKINSINVSHPAYHSVKELREIVLRKPLGRTLDAVDTEDDPKATIITAALNDKIIGCVMMFPTQELSTIRLRQMAVHNQWQGRGIGQLLLSHAEQKAVQMGIKDIVLHAREQAIEFYKKAGFLQEGLPFMELGITHVFMRKHIATNR